MRVVNKTSPLNGSSSGGQSISELAGKIEAGSCQYVYKLLMKCMHHEEPYFMYEAGIVQGSMTRYKNQCHTVRFMVVINNMPPCEMTYILCGTRVEAC